MCQWGATRNTWAGYRISSSRSPRTADRGVDNRRPRIEHIMWGRRAVVMTLSANNKAFCLLAYRLASRFAHPVNWRAVSLH